MRKIIMIVVLLIVAGCQLDIQGPSVTSKILYKGENNNQEYLSRGSGMSGGTSYAAGGGSQMSSTGSSGSMSWGNNK